MNETRSEPLDHRLSERLSAWRVVPERRVETEGSLLVFGRRDHEPVVLKLARREGDEWLAGRVLAAFRGRGTVRLLDAVDGAMLLERIVPGTPLVHRSVRGDDAFATEKLAEVVGRMPACVPPPGVPTVADWGRGFARCLATGRTEIEQDLLLEAERTYVALAGSQSSVRLLHGDLHHYNVLLDGDRGWIAIDPKGVAGEPAFEIGAMLRNPIGAPELFLDPRVIETRVARTSRVLGLDPSRVLAWGLAQAVLSVVWALEDGMRVAPDHPWLALARRIRRMSTDIPRATGGATDAAVGAGALESIRLVDVDETNRAACIALRSRADQAAHVPDVASSLALARRFPDARPLAIVAGPVGTIVGFAMYGIDRATGRWKIFRLFVDERVQGHGIGRSALGALIATLESAHGARTILVSYQASNGAAARLYASFGFEVYAREGTKIHARRGPADGA